MTTVVNSAPSESSDNGMGFFLGMIVLLVIVALFLYVILPLIRSGIGAQAPQINVPDKIDVNVQTPNQPK